MAETKYKLRYLPMSYEDFEQKIVYIAENCRMKKLLRILLKERHYPYYRIYVKNFVIYYVIIDDEGDEKIMEVRRFLHNKQDRGRKI